MSRILFILALLVLAPAAGGHYVQGDGVGSSRLMAQSSQPPAQEGFVPVDQLPDDEQLPAAPLVAAAYGVAWAAILIYVLFLWRRLARVERELADVARKMNSGTPRQP